MQTPFGKYEQIPIKTTNPRVLETKIYKPTETAQTWRISKMDGPAPGSYNIIESFEKTQRAKIQGPPKATTKKDIFTDDYAKNKKFLPAPTLYQDQDKGFKMLTKARQDISGRQ